MIRTNALLGIAMVMGGAGAAHAAELQHDTAAAWQEYVRSATARMQARLDGEKPFLWIDETADRAGRVRGGEILVMPMAGHGVRSVPHGLIHDWVGAAFIPNATIETLESVVQDYDRYKDIYKPVVTDSRTLESSASSQESSMVWQRHVLFLNAAMRGRYRASNFTVDANRGYSVVEATRIQQIEEYGQPGEHLLPPDSGGGFIWRIYSISRYEQRDGGVYLEVEVIALSRDIPGSLRWLVNPVVNHLSVNSLTMTLEQTRGAVERQHVTLAMREQKDRK